MTTYTLPTVLNLQNVLACYNEILALGNKKLPIVTIDGTLVNRIDSSGIALLLTLEQIKSSTNYKLINLSQEINNM